MYRVRVLSEFSAFEMNLLMPIASDMGIDARANSTAVIQF